MTTQEKLIDLRTRLNRKAELNEQDAGEYGGHPFKLMAQARAMAVRECVQLLNEYFPHLDLPAVPPVFVNPNA